MGHKVVINTCYGGFGLSDEAQAMLEERKGDVVDIYDVPRHDLDLVDVVEALGDEANSAYAELFVQDVEGHRYFIHENRGLERVVTPDDLNWIYFPVAAGHEAELVEEANIAPWQCRWAECASGLIMSVQAGYGLYCTTTGNIDRWDVALKNPEGIIYTHVEVGFPNREIAELMPYAESPNIPTKTVYPWVPVAVVRRIIEDNGGLIGGEVPIGVLVSKELDQAECWVRLIEETK